MSRSFLLLFCAFASVLSQVNDDLFILIDEVSVFSCRGVKNEIKISEDDINIINEKGNKVYYIRAPGNYSLHFKNLEVKKDFGFLAGEIGVTLQVPIIEGPAGMRFDLPYTMVPETGLLTQHCDANSGIVERNGKQYCRYCDLCAVTESIEQKVNERHNFLPNIQGETHAPQECGGGVEAKAYDFKRTISLPGKAALERMVKDKIQGIDKEVTKRLNKGRGRFQVFLNLIAAAKPSMTQKMWFDNTEDCKTCNQNNGYLYCDIENCKSSWAQQCLHNTARIAACYTVEFNYRMTSSYADVLQFLRENNYPDQNVEVAKPRTRPTAAPRPHPVATTQRARPQPKFVERVPVNTEEEEEAAPVEATQTDNTDAESRESVSERCVAKMAQRLTHLRRYCTIFWNAKLCCTHCSSVCQSE